MPTADPHPAESTPARETLGPLGGPQVMHQTWRDLLFLHWAVDPAAVQASLPDGLKVDTYQGQAYLGLVPFEMCGVRPVGLPPLPGLSWFGELNLRTYVRSTRDGRPGVWFYSLDAHQHLAVWLARTCFALPYHYAAIRVDHDPPSDHGRRVRYHWRRGGGSLDGQPQFDYLTPPDPAGTKLPTARPGTLEYFLVERYLLFSCRPLWVTGPETDPGSTQRAGPAPPPAGGRLHVGRVVHAPYRIAPVELNHYDAEVFRLNGWAIPTGPPVRPCCGPRK